MRIYNTLTNNIEKVSFIKEPVKIYLCGVTVYDDSHIGHARTIIIFDVLRRFLISKNLQVIFIQNFTDIDDKIITRAVKENTTFQVISNKYIERYYDDFDALNVMRATVYPKVTEHMKDIILFIAELIKRDKAYVGLNGVYYRVKSFSSYGKLSKKNDESIETGARIEVDESKEDPRDFALWKFTSSKPKWKSPWGDGRPGWHIECSVMALKYLHHNFDIHGGGQDLIFPHHENEIAQSEGLNEMQFAKLWIHVGMVTIKSEKMSKSLGNTVKISEILRNVNPNVIRLFCISSHYSKPLDYSPDIINEFKNKWRQIENAYYELKFRINNSAILGNIDKVNDDVLKNEFLEYLKKFEDYLEDDLNSSNAMTIFFQFINKINALCSTGIYHDTKFSEFIFNILKRFMFILGLKINEISQTEKYEIDQLIRKRTLLRNIKNFKESDEIRQQLRENHHIELIDHKEFTIWKKVSK